MALQHALPGDPISVRPLGDQLPLHKTVALFKSQQLEVIRLVLRAGKGLPPHQVPGEITIHCIEGEMDVTAHGKRHVLAPGQMLFLEGGVSHGVLALQDCSALVTIALVQPK